MDIHSLIVSRLKGSWDILKKSIFIRNRYIRSICVSIFIISIGFGLTAPVFPLYSQSLGATVTLIGGMFMGFAISRSLFQWPGGWLVDKVGDKSVFVCTMFFCGVTVTLYALLTNSMFFVGLKALEGMLVGIALPAILSALARLSDERSRGEAMGAYAFFYCLGFAFGSSMSATVTLVAGGDMKVVFIASAITILAGTLVFLRYIQSPTKRISFVRKEEGLSQKIIKMFKPLLGTKGRLLAVLSIVLFCGQFASGSLTPILPLYIVDVLKMNITHVSLAFTLNFLIFGFSQILWGRLADKFGSVKLLTVGIMMMAAGFWGMALAISFIMFILAFGMEVLGAAAIWPTVKKVVAELFKEDLGRAYGIQGTISDMGLILGPIVGSMLYSLLPNSVFIVNGIAGIAVVWLYLAIIKKLDSNRTPKD